MAKITVDFDREMSSMNILSDDFHTDIQETEFNHTVSIVSGSTATSAVYEMSTFTKGMTTKIRLTAPDGTTSDHILLDRRLVFMGELGDLMKSLVLDDLIERRFGVRTII